MTKFRSLRLQILITILLLLGIALSAQQFSADTTQPTGEVSGISTSEISTSNGNTTKAANTSNPKDTLIKGLIVAFTLAIIVMWSSQIYVYCLAKRKNAINNNLL